MIYWAGRIEFIQIVCCVVGLIVTALAVTVAMVVLTDDYEHDESLSIAEDTAARNVLMSEYKY